MTHCKVCGTAHDEVSRKRGPWCLMALLILAAYVAYENVYKAEMESKIEVEDIAVPRVCGTSFRVSRPSRPQRGDAVRRPAPHTLNY